MALFAVPRELRPLSGHRLLGADARLRAGGHAAGAARAAQGVPARLRPAARRNGADVCLADEPAGRRRISGAGAGSPAAEGADHGADHRMAGGEGEHDAAALRRRGPALDRPDHPRPARLARRHTAGRANHARLHLPSRVPAALDESARDADCPQPPDAVADQRDDPQPGPRGSSARGVHRARRGAHRRRAALRRGADQVARRIGPPG